MYGMRAQDNAPATRFRSDRVCRVNGELYFSTRENTLEGPFDGQVIEREIQAYIERMQRRIQPLNRGAAFASRLAPTGECDHLWERACSRRGLNRQPIL